MIQPKDLRVLSALFRRFALPHRRALVLLVLVSTAGALATAVQPFVLAPALDTALLTRARPATSLADLTLNNLGPTLLAGLGLGSEASAIRILLSVVLLYVLVVVLSAALSFTALQIMRWIRTAVANDMQATMYRHLLSLSMPFFVTQRTGELCNRFVYDVISTAQCFDPIVKGFFEAGLQLFLYGFILVRTDPWLAAAVVAVALLHLVITRLLQGQIRQRSVDSFDAYAQVSGLVQESIQGIRIVKSFSAERFEQERLRQILSGLKRTVLKFGFYSNSEAPLREVANAVAVGTALLVSFAALSAGRLTLPGFVLFMIVARQMIGPFGLLSGAFIQLQAMIGASKRVLEILDARPTVTDGPREAEAFQDRIVLEGVSFGYQEGHIVVRGVELEIPKGSVVAVVGPSGSGKTTLGDLVLRLYDPTTGRVTYDGTDIREFRQESYRRRFGVVSQEALLFNATVEENIAYGRPLVAEEVERAARLANAADFVERTPDGYRTVVGDRGIRLSGGQRQRIAIARAVYGRPEILILDEATSSLDSESEQQVQDAIDSAISGTTALVIAHRLSTIMKADRILVLEAGQIEASGTHRELLEGSSVYRRLYQAQFRNPEERASA